MLASLRRSTRRAALLTLALGMAALVSASHATAASGALDTSYGAAGVAHIPNASTPGLAHFSLPLADGSTIVVGTTGSPTTGDAFIAKLTPAGALDASFATGGIRTFDLGLGDVETAKHVAATSTGFVIGGSAFDTVTEGYTGFIAKVTSAGALETWGTGGILTAGVFDEVVGVAELAGGDVMFAGNKFSDGAFRVGRATTAGISWNQTIPATSDTCGLADLTTFQALSPTTFLAAGSGYRTTASIAFCGAPTGAAGSSELVGLTFTDTDPGAGNVPTTRTAFPTLVSTNTSTLQSNGSVWVAGATNAGTTSARGAIFQLAGTGALTGQLDLPTAVGGWEATAVSRSVDGLHLVAGNLGTDRVRTVRMTASGTLDPSWGQGGIADNTYGTGVSRASYMTLDSLARPVLYGTTGTSAAAYRLDPRTFASTSLGEISHAPDFLNRLQPLTAAFPVTNGGPDLTDVVVDIDVPTSFEGQSYSSTHGGTVVPVADGSGATWTVPQLAAGATATLTLSARPGDTGVFNVGSSITAQSAIRTGAAPVAKTHAITVYGAATPRNDRIIGTPFKDRIDALAGDDVVFGLASNDVLLGNLGNDTLDGGTGNDYLDGGDGNDKLYGRAGNDKQYGQAGADYLNGAEGNDLLNGGIGNDRIFGGSGNDYLIGQQGSDFLSGGPGRDRLHGDGGPDKLYGGTGSDWVYGGDSSDLIVGGHGNDWLRGYMGNDTIHGDAGNDLLNGGAGRDRLFGGVGNDIIRADDGKAGDSVNCGSGWDVVYANVGDRITRDCEFVKYDVPAGTPRSKR